MADPSDKILHRLMGLHPKVIDLNLDRQHRIHDALDNPQDKLPPVIHVAGTNGKGSTLAYMRSLLEAAGLSVHAYTSPHLCRFHERIRLAGQLINEDELSDLLDECERANEGASITFFEITTAAAFLAFSRKPADVLLLETGLGGEFDSTNVIERPAATVLTPIDLDHQQFLGADILGIARTKAGIMRKEVPCIIGPQQDDVRETLEQCAASVGAVPKIFGQEWTAYGDFGRFVYQDEQGLLDLPLPNLSGDHQIINAGTALAALRYGAGIAIPEDVAARGVTSANWPGRLQRLATHNSFLSALEGSDIWLDGGHNPHAGLHIARALQDLKNKDGLPLFLIAGMLNTKDASGFFAPFKGVADQVLTVPIPDELNSLSAEALAGHADKGGVSAVPFNSAEAAIEWLSGMDKPMRVLFCGSLYFAGYILRQADLLPS